jgi:hypothetical protein
MKKKVSLIKKFVMHLFTYSYVLKKKRIIFPLMREYAGLTCLNKYFRTYISFCMLVSLCRLKYRTAFNKTWIGGLFIYPEVT